jgi:leucyl aminopeptidase
MTKVSLCTTKKAIGERVPIVLLLDKRWSADAAFRDLDQRCKGALSAEAKRRSFHGDAGNEVVVQTHGAIAPQLVGLLGCAAEPDVAALYGLADRIAAIAERETSSRVTVWRPAGLAAAQLRTLAEGVLMARHRFLAFKTENNRRPPLGLRFAVERADAGARDALREAETRARAVCLARDLANTPAGSLPPAALGERAADLAGGDLSVRVLDVAALEKLGMGALLAVGQGSRHQPRLIEMTYEPAAAPPRHVALVGKGITFDSGGLSLKPANAMELMKRDMAGGATVIAAMSAVAELGLPLRVRAYIPTAENMPGGNAIRPGDVITAYSGKTIEILNTDAEGRLVLADALAYAAEAEPRALVDFATLTGAVRIALGKRYAAVLGNDRRLVDCCLAAAAGAGEGLWELPLVADYRGDLTSQVADIKNVGGNGAGTIIAGLFLSEFVGKTPWAHIDFSSTVMSDGYPCHPAGPSGYGVRTALGVLAALAADAD